jgi:hypothetical protein
MVSGLAAMGAKIKATRGQLPVTGSAHKAAVVGDALVVTAIAMLDVTIKCRSATQFDRAHNATLCRA